MIKRINLRKSNVARSKTIRDINRQIILNYIREEGPISRADIARVTALQRSTISLIVDELSELGLVQESYGESSGGRPPRLLSLKTAEAISIGIDLGKKDTIVGTCDLSGRLLEHKEFPTSSNAAKTIDRIIETANYFIERNNGSIEGIGLSVPGLVEAWDGKLVKIPHLEWHEPDLAKKIQDATGLQVRMENDTNAVALAELWLGRPEISNVRDFIVVFIHKGIGTGVVFDGQIYRGKDGVAGEFGHMTIGQNAPIKCSGGNDDCWEAFASERAAMARYLENAGESAKKDLDFNQLINLAQNDDSHAIKALKDTAKYIGLGISNLIQGLSPELTIVAGSIVKAWPLVSEEIIEAADAGLCQGFPAVKVMPSTLGKYPSLMGAFSLVLADKFSSISTG
ncbi:MAG: ROK family transcriptional regulator [Pyrinomonadaceae bacterium]|nr:ROK family transcriptional regulator [Pyrinomonadaceae bacterium]